MTNESTRRAVLIGLAGTPFLAGTIAAGIAAPAEAATVDRTAWDHTFAAYLKRDAEEKAHDAMLAPRYARFRAACKAIPHVTVIANPNDRLSRRELTTAEHDDIMLAKSVIEPHPSVGRYTAPHDAEYADFERACRDLLAALEQRRAEENRLHNEIVGDADAEKSETLGEATCALRSTLIEMPAPDAPALLWKLEYLFGFEAGGDDEEAGYSASYCPKWINAVMADARRLLSHGRA